MGASEEKINCSRIKCRQDYFSARPGVCLCVWQGCWDEEVSSTPTSTYRILTVLGCGECECVGPAHVGWSQGPSSWLAAVRASVLLLLRTTVRAVGCPSWFPHRFAFQFWPVSCRPCTLHTESMADPLRKRHEPHRISIQQRWIECLWRARPARNPKVDDACLFWGV